IDRVPVAYPSVDGLIGDLRRMGATNVLAERPRRSLSRRAAAAAAENFAHAAEGGRTTETFEIIHFACWTPAAEQRRNAH
ncbi:MAG TPA: SAM-dependent methyltransferase, partial [Sphingomicrobium sp.]|nr:SAM-dependent methyltransferase [Sphingomicrobium sp.]